jgi:hypothetical protein
VLNGNTVVYAAVSTLCEVSLELSCGVLIAVDLENKVKCGNIYNTKGLTILPSIVRNCVETTFRKYWNIY